MTESFRFDAVFPEFADRRIGLGARLANDIEPHMYGNELAAALPSRPGKHVMQLIQLPNVDDLRIGANRITKLIKYQGSIYWTPPSAQDLFFAWLRDHDWDPKPSPSGRTAQHLHAQLGGWVHWLKDEQTLRFLNEMTKPQYANKGAHYDFMRNSLKGRVLSGEALLKKLLDRKVFAIGYLHQCPRCDRESWYPLKDIQDTLTCSRCLHEYAATPHIGRGHWTYKTTGPFSIPGFADGAYCALLAMDWFGRESHHSVTSAMSFEAQMPSGDRLEADFGLLWHGKFVTGESEGVAFGECKSFNEFAEMDFERMRTIARAFPGSVLAFCTLKKQLTTKEKKGLIKIARAGRTRWTDDRPMNPVIVLTGHELLSSTGPPYCWRGLGMDEKFRPLISMLDYCDATQQVHLGLPSWREEWMAKALKKREKRGQHAQKGRENPA